MDPSLLHRPVILGLTLVGIAGLSAANPPAESAVAGADYRLFDERIHPILEAKCYKCHGQEGKKIKGGLRLTNREALLKGGDFGPSVNLEKPGESHLLAMLSFKDENHEMPPKGKLPDEDIAAIADWIEEGAPYNPEKEIFGHDEEEEAIPDPASEEARAWWAYRSIADPKPPTVKTAGWAEHPVDAFIAANLEAEGLAPNPRAEPRVLIRRAFFDLIGLPPTPQEVGQFERDFAADPDRAWMVLIDELLARPQYGERWARHWLDLVRYAETNGFERDGDKPEIWRYRDYVIEAFNADLPYDRFVREQIAGDELDAVDERSLAATGYHRLMQWDDEPADRLQHKYDVLDDKRPHHRRDLSGHLDRMRALPRPQGRSLPPEGLLQLHGVLPRDCRLHQGQRRPDPLSPGKRADPD